MEIRLKDVSRGGDTTALACLRFAVGCTLDWQLQLKSSKGESNRRWTGWKMGESPGKYGQEEGGVFLSKLISKSKVKGRKP